MARRFRDGYWYTSSIIIGFPFVFAAECSDYLFRHLKYDVAESLKSILCEIPASVKSLSTQLTAVDYYMDFIRFSLHNTVDDKVVNMKSLEDLQVWILLLEEGLLDIGGLLEESNAQSLRIETCFLDIFSALEASEPQQQDGPGALVSVPCEPLINSSDIFPSEPARVFMTALRLVLLQVRTTSPRVILQELNDLFLVSNIDQLALSEVTTDTAMRSLTFILQEIDTKLCNEDYILWEDYLDQSRCTFLMTCFAALNRPSHLQDLEVHSLDYKHYVEDRGLFAELVLEDVCRGTIPVSTRPVLEPNSSDPPSRLWQKLRAAGSLSALTEGKEEEKCPVCLEDNVTRQNFCVLDDCDHLFCVQCIAIVFERR